MVIRRMLAPFFVFEDISAAEADRQNACRSTSGCFYIAARSAYNSSDSASVTREPGTMMSPVTTIYCPKIPPTIKNTSLHGLNSVQQNVA